MALGKKVLLGGGVFFPISPARRSPRIGWGWARAGQVGTGGTPRTQDLCNQTSNHMLRVHTEPC